MTLPVAELKYLLKLAACAETSYTPKLWTPDNPTYGHCAVFTLIVQDLLGGKVVRGSIANPLKDMLGYGSHYWNALNDGTVIDLSRDQFPAEFPYDLLIAGKLGEPGEKPDYSDKRSYILQTGNTAQRYDILKSRFEKALNSNPLFTDYKFQRCWELAFSENAKCLKMRFACVVYDDCGEFITSDVNRLMTGQFNKERFCALDGSNCIRMGMESRTDATIGDCGHAPIWCLANVWKLGYFPEDLRMLNFYEGGFKPDGSPWWRSEASYTCTYCENMFAIFGLDKIYGAFDGKWQPLYTKNSFYSSARYATKEKKA